MAAEIDYIDVTPIISSSEDLDLALRAATPDELRAELSRRGIDPVGPNLVHWPSIIKVAGTIAFAMLTIRELQGRFK